MRLALIAIVVTPSLLAAQSVARINVTPAAPSVVAGETLQLRAEAVDSAGRPVPGTTVRFQVGSVSRVALTSRGWFRAGGRVCWT